MASQAGVAVSRFGRKKDQKRKQRSPPGFFACLAGFRLAALKILDHHRFAIKERAL
jgi:hypothetical protein